jgi:hypothetical protein
MALGAFLAGVMLADSEYRHELQLDIDPFKGLLLGLFFIAVGMLVDLGLFRTAPLLVLGLAAGIVLLKMLLLYPVAKTFGYCNRADASLFALALSQAGEFAFVIFGAASALVPAPTIALLNAAVAASMLTTPLLLMVYERYLAQRIDKGAAAPPDAIHETNPVIVAGFGRSGRWWCACCADSTSAPRSSTRTRRRSIPCGGSATRPTTATPRASTCWNRPAPTRPGSYFSPSTIPTPRWRR